ncbi:membrane protein [Microbacterium phage Cen1621]|uniref:Membrane protein n=1 Tax=Microbacterium phage Cen1621 TaxID=2965191 RepID=A0A9E7QAE0_9CAUD|nr:membrane protein [Microbacterium phage Cen1621]
MNNAAAATIASLTVANGGATFTAEGELVTSGFSVAGVAPALRLAVEDFTPAAVLAVVARFAGAGFFGTWIEEGEVWIEPTNVLADADEAHALAEARGEIAYYDLDNLAEIRL